MDLKEYEILVSLFLLFSSFLVLAFRERRNPLIGFRVGYTYHSERVWKKVNTFSGIANALVSLFLLGLAFLGVSLNVFVLVMTSLLLLVVFIGLTMAKGEYELEDISTEAPEKPTGEKLEGSVKPYLITQLAFLGLYFLLVVILWGEIPGRVATHFSTSGPDSYGGKLWGIVEVPILVWLIPFVLTFPAKDPGFFARAKFYPTSPGSWCLFTTLVSFGLTVVFISSLVYNAGMAPATIMNYATYAIIGIVILGLYLLLKDVGARPSQP
ncbi:DUF1648 domain-containing protein [Thermococcus celer]|uniref:DUF1648 domain-containing protein n=1 Tax=Thermococcus celer Vu 13 = JCM 8558 TaxID=1293037 RepID=A0A218P2T6_THECE|nr:DUF1648 domain-containing protein [Thermococcus celer]ASI99244.1 hypothetical protein A3L02_06540 [Thermococcus celer Vu 13 = JCM 8558]